MQFRSAATEVRAQVAHSVQVGLKPVERGLAVAASAVETAPGERLARAVGELEALRAAVATGAAARLNTAVAVAPATAITEQETQPA